MDVGVFEIRLDRRTSRPGVFICHEADFVPIGRRNAGYDREALAQIVQFLVRGRDLPNPVLRCRYQFIRGTVKLDRPFVEQGHIIAGSPATVRDKMEEAIKLLRVGHLMCLLHIGTMPKELTFKNMNLFSKEVMPGLKNIYEEYDDPWWPQRVGEQAAPTAAD